MEKNYDFLLEDLLDSFLLSGTEEEKSEEEISDLTLHLIMSYAAAYQCSETDQVTVEWVNN